MDIKSIKTDRLVLRPFAAEDAPALFAQFADWEVIRWLAMPPWPYRLADADQFIAGLSSLGAGESSLALTFDGALIGGIGVRMKEASPSQSSRGPNLGFWLGRQYWGRGFMTEAGKALLACGFKSGLGDTVYSGAFVGNTASLRIQEKLGFVHDINGMLRSRPRNGEFPHISTVLRRSAFKE